MALITRRIHTWRGRADHSTPPGALKLFAAVGAGILAGSLFLPWYTLAPDLRFPDDRPTDFGLQTAWQHSAVLAAVLMVLAVLALRLRVAAGLAAVIVAAAIVFAPAEDVQRDAGPWLALLGALVAAFPGQVTRLGALALLGALFGTWYDSLFFIVTRGSAASEITSAINEGRHTAWQVSAPTAIALALLALLVLARPALARATAWVAIGLVIGRIIAPHQETAYGAWLALAGSILAWAGGLEAHAPPNITDQCSPATRSSTSPASPASS